MKVWFFFLLLTGLLGWMEGKEGLAAPQARNEAVSVPKGNLSQSLIQLADAIAQVKADYVLEIPEEKLVEGALRGLLGSLDPYSSYLSPQRFRNLKYQAFGEFGGIGLEIEPSESEHAMKVVTTIDDSPSHKAGLRSGDIITHIDGVSVATLDFDEAVEKLRGEENSELTMTIYRPGEAPQEIKIRRSLIRVPSVRWKIEKNIGYIRLTTFNNRTENSLKDAMTGIKDALGKDLEGIILDLRNNGGGQLDQAVKVSDAFLNSGEILSMRGREGRILDRFFARPGDLAQGIPMVVLINKGSASAAEVVAGALQDNERAVVLGETSCGKGSIQKLMPLKNGGALRLTVALYYTPSGKEIQGKGIQPHIIIQDAVVQSSQERDRKEPEGSRGKDPQESGGPIGQDLNLFETDYPLRRALDLLIAKKFLITVEKNS